MTQTAAHLEKILLEKDKANAAANRQNRVRGTTGEGVLNSKVVRALNSEDGILAHKHHASVMTPHGHADVYGVCNGRAFYLEGKVDPKKYKVTRAQHDFLKVAYACGAIVGVYTSVEEALQIVRSGGQYMGHFTL